MIKYVEKIVKYLENMVTPTCDEKAHFHIPENSSVLTRKPQEENLRIFLNEKGFPLKFTQLPIHCHHNIGSSPWILFRIGARIPDDF